MNCGVARASPRLARSSPTESRTTSSETATSPQTGCWGRRQGRRSGRRPRRRRSAAQGRHARTEIQTRLLFDVATVLKGDPPRFAEVVTSTGPCEFRFAVGETYLVVGKRQGAMVNTDRCQGNVKGADTITDRVEAIRDALTVPPPESRRHRPRRLRLKRSTNLNRRAAPARRAGRHSRLLRRSGRRGGRAGRGPTGGPRRG